jgi:REP element-mobilizing transposase RayT
MPNNPSKRDRRTIRLKNRDYSAAGMYFVTVCTHGRACILGKVVDSKMELNAYGKIVEVEWIRSSKIRSEIRSNIYQVMPNHFHAIVEIAEKPIGLNGVTDVVGAHGRAPLRRKPKSLSSLMAGFKSSVASKINGLRHTPGMPVWQRNYYEHIIRNENELRQIGEYVIHNVLKWELDAENPKNWRKQR